MNTTDPCNGNQISGQILGDPHFVFGQQASSDPSLASFNFDDNAGTTEVVWFTAVDASDNEIIVKYRCQEFVNVTDGYSVDRLIIEDGTLSSVYEVSTDNSDVLKNGIIWNSEDSDIILGDNVWIMKVSSATVPDCPGDFSWIPFDFAPMSGMHEIKEIGGIWWSMWKKASTLTATTLNNPSSAGLDGISGFLDDGSSRSSFTGTPSSLREAFNQTTMNEVVQKRNALATQTGSVNFDWDPLMDDTPTCVSVPELSLASCPYPGLGATFLNDTDPTVAREFQMRLNHGSSQPVDYDIDEIGAFMNTTDPCNGNQIEICTPSWIVTGKQSGQCH